MFLKNRFPLLYETIRYGRKKADFLLVVAGLDLICVNLIKKPLLYFSNGL